MDGFSYAHSEEPIMRRGGRLAVALGVAMALGLAAGAHAADWPQFLGPQRDGVAHAEKGLARSWPEGGPKHLWETPVGPGYGGAAVYGDSAFLLDREDDARDVLRRISLADGKDVWRVTYDAPGKFDHNGSRSTPATDGRLVYCIGAFGAIHAVRFSDGSPIWQADLMKDWDAKLSLYGVATSPLLCGERLIVMPWGKKAALAALDKATGRVVWTTPNPNGVVQEYQSPVPMKLDGRDVILATGRHGYLVGADAETGRQLFEYDRFPKVGWDIPSPLPVGGGRIFMTSGYGAGCVMLKVEREGELYKVTELFRNMSMGSVCAQPLLYGGYIYGNSSNTGGGLRCLTLDGKVVWDSKKGRGPTFDNGAVLIADGLIYAIDGRKGDLYMAEAVPGGYHQLGEAPLLAPPEPWAPLAIADGRLLARDCHKLYCLDAAGH
jgi:outer membrane protein assembly factor BamB